MGLTGVFINVSTRLQTAEALRPVVSAQREAEKESKVWDLLQPTSQRVILMASATNVTSIPASPHPTLHQFLNTNNLTALQANCALTYSGNNLYIPTPYVRTSSKGTSWPSHTRIR